MKEREIQLQKDLFGDISDDDDSSFTVTNRELPLKNAVATSSRSPANSSSTTSSKHSSLPSSTCKNKTAIVKEEPGVNSTAGGEYNNKPPKSSVPSSINGLANDKAAGSPRIVIKIDKHALSGSSSVANNNGGGVGSSSKNRDDNKKKVFADFFICIFMFRVIF